MAAEAKSDDPEVYLRKPKEPGGNFYVSLTEGSFIDSMQPLLGLFSLPTVAFYGGDHPQGELYCVVRSGSRLPGLACAPARVLAEAGPDYDFFFVISDASELLARHGRTLNLVHHAWANQELEFGKRRNGSVRAGVFTAPGSGVAPHKPGAADLGFQCLSDLRMNVHPQKGRGGAWGGMCCSPNNARFTVQEGCGALTWFWGVARAEDGRACVSLYWLLAEPMPALRDACQAETTLEGLLDALAAVLGDDAPCVQAALVAFSRPRGDAAAVEAWPAETAPLARAQGGGGGGPGKKKKGVPPSGAAPPASAAPSAAPPSGPVLRCAQCEQGKASSEFSGAQRRKEERRRCKACVG